VGEEGIMILHIEEGVSEVWEAIEVLEVSAALEGF